MPKVSVIIPVYNKEKYLEDTLHSVLNQEFLDLEVIAVNDGSKDRSLEILNSIAEQDSRLRIIDIPNGGVSHARNVGMDNAKGEYLTFIDGDDLVSPFYVGNMYRCMEDSSADLVIGGIEKRWADRSQTVTVQSNHRGMCSISEVMQDFESEQRRCGIYGNCVAKMFPRKFAQLARFDETMTLAEDFDFYLKIYSLSKNVYFLDTVDYYYLQDAENSSVLVEDSKIDFYSQVLLNIRYRDFLDEFGELDDNTREFIETRISSYVFFTLYHSETDSFDCKFHRLSQLQNLHGISMKPSGQVQRIVLALFTHGNRRLLKFLLMGRKLICQIRKI